VWAYFRARLAAMMAAFNILARWGMEVDEHNPSMWPQLSSPLEHFFLSLALLLLSWCTLDLAAHIRVASARELTSRLTRPVTVSASWVPRTRLSLALIPCPYSGDS
jgi:hypothetical protein